MLIKPLIPCRSKKLIARSTVPHFTVPAVSVGASSRPRGRRPVAFQRVDLQLLCGSVLLPTDVTGVTDFRAASYVRV